MRTFLKNMVAVLFCALLVLPAAGGELAYADDADDTGAQATLDAAASADASASDESDDATDDEADEAEEEPTGNVYLIVVPHLNWTDIDNEHTPTIQYLVAHYAVANVVTEDKVDITAFEQTGRLHYMRVNTSNVDEIEQAVSSVYFSLGPNDSLVVTSSPSLAKIDNYKLEGYGVAILVDAGDNGILTSTSVRRSGLILSSNLGHAIESLLNAPQRNPANLSVYPLTNTLGALSRTSTLARDNSIVTAVWDSQPAFLFWFLLVVGVTLAVSVVSLFLDTRIHPAYLQHLLPATRILWIIALAIPLATYIMFLQLPTMTDAEIALDYCRFSVMELAFICIVVALVFRWTYSLETMLAMTVGIMLIDQLIGGPMTATGFMSYTPLKVTRYYGIGNEGASCVWGSWIMLASMWLNEAKKGSRLAKSFRTWIFPVATGVIILIIAAPWWGSNFGVIIWGTVSALVAWAMFNGVKVTWKRVILMTLAAGALAFFVLVLDSTFNTESHMGTTIEELNEGWYLVVFQILYNMVELSLTTITFSPPLSVVFAFLFGFLIWLRVKKPGSYEKFWDDNKAFTSGYTALLLASVLMLLIEDSGIIMPALVLLYCTATLIWLVCKQHSWHIRKWVGRRITTRGE